MIARIRNNKIKGMNKVTEFFNKFQERRLQWYRYLMRIRDDYIGRRVVEMMVEGTRA